MGAAGFGTGLPAGSAGEGAGSGQPGADAVPGAEHRPPPAFADRQLCGRGKQK